MRKKQGFTLVELLVVIGIIALLISILLPALNRVRWQAKTVTCTARMRDVVQAVVMYATENKGALPPRGDLEASSSASMGGTNPTPWSSPTVFNAQYEQEYKNAKGQDIGQHMGRMFRTGVLKNRTVYQCPDAQSPANPVTDTRAFTYYHFNPHVAYANAAGTVLRFWWTKLSNYGRGSAADWKHGFTGAIGPMTIPTFRKAILTEPMYGTNNVDMRYVTHLAGKKRAFNFAYPDGSVQTYVANEFSSRQIDCWTQFLDQSNALQFALDGGSIVWTTKWTNTVYNAIPVRPN